MSEPMLKIRNRHSLSCGDPPIVESDNSDCYIGYFENRHGEQWIFTLDRKAGKSILRGGDIGWNSEHDVVNGIVAGLVLGLEEQLWLSACWAAAFDHA